MNAPLRVEAIALDQIHESPTNPRRTFSESALAELADDIKRRGVLQPVLVRPRAVGFELVFGARRVRAVKLAGLDSIVCIVREMSDAEVIETQVIENAKRVDIHPLEEGDAYTTLIRDHHLSVEDIASRIGRDVAHIRRRIRITTLHPEVRNLFFGGHLFVGHAEMIAGLALSVQIRAAKILAGQDEPLSLRQAADVIRRDFLLRLAMAPFDPQDMLLVREAGACTVCPKRTGAQQELFAAAAPDESCTDPDCWKSKIEADWKQRAAAATKTGRKVIKDANKAFEKQNFGEARTKWDGAYADVDREVYIDGKQTTYRKALGKHLESKDLVLARDHAGEAHDLITKKDLAAIAKKAGVPVDYSDKPRDAAPSNSPATSKPKERVRPVEEEAEERAEKQVLGAVVLAASKRKLDDGFVRWIADRLITLHIGTDIVCERRGLAKLDAKKLAGGDLRGLVAELLIGDQLQDRYGDVAKDLDKLLGEWGASWSKTVATAIEAVKKERAAKSEKPSKPAAATKKPKSKRAKS